MSLCRHILVVFFIFATYQSAKSEDSTHRSLLVPEDPISTEPDAATFNFTQNHGFFSLKISMEKAECVNDKTKTETSPSTKPLRNPEEAKKLLGSEENPAESCNDVDDNGNHHIKSNMSDQAFKVFCNVERKFTCLLINSKIDASSINSAAITLSDQIWLSQTDFDVNLLYNKIEGITGTNRAQISHLLSTSSSVNQKIKYYYGTAFSNGTFIKTKDNKVESLKALSWNDHLVGSKITKQLPMQFTTSKADCWSGNSDWMCSYIIFQDNSNKRLPVTDFYIEDVRAKPDVPTSGDQTTPIQKIYFELVDLCFNYD